MAETFVAASNGDINAFENMGGASMHPHAGGLTGALLRGFLAKRARRAGSAAGEPHAVDAVRTAASDRAAIGVFAGIVSIICNVLLCLAKALVGLASGSVSIVADAVNNLSDASSNIVSMIGFKLAGRKADDEHPYGYGRYEYLAGLTVAVLVCAVGIGLVRESIGKIVHYEPSEFGLATLVVLGASIVVKLWMMSFNKAAGAFIDSETLRAAAIDSRNDVITTAAVLACAIISQLVGYDLDGWVGAGVGAFILVSGIGLIRDAVSPLLGEAPDEALVKSIRERILSYPGVLGTHDLMVHDYGPGKRYASAHVEMPAEEDVVTSHEVLDRIEQDFRERDGLIMTLHLDPVITCPGDVEDDGTAELRERIERCVRSIDPRLTVHDVRAENAGTHATIYFDCVRPEDLAMSDAELRERIVSLVGAQSHPHNACIVTIDHGYVSGEQ